ncbi:hypothetical protein H2200_003495 [Cladophialophora chaetospira]|uniref:Uncharacterized protein n=1 Tax=Cladophialophora chaetospira TaxID=386627 RepID=A0AA38XHG3_9EURO|nr:hypothetical protein H2200_003495 [Cladophialophora chaetospira]
MQSMGSSPDSLWSFLAAWKARKLLVKVEVLLVLANKRLAEKRMGGLTKQRETRQEDMVRIISITKVAAQLDELWMLVKKAEKDKIQDLADHFSSR